MFVVVADAVPPWKQWCSVHVEPLGGGTTGVSLLAGAVLDHWVAQVRARL